MTRSATRYTRVHMPRQGDIVRIDFSSQDGHEQKGYRPALIISRNQYNERASTVVACPITRTRKGLPIHMDLDERTNTQGVVLCDQVRAIDPIARGAVFIESCPPDILADVVDTVIGLVELDPL